MLVALATAAVGLVAARRSRRCTTATPGNEESDRDARRPVPEPAAEAPAEPAAAPAPERVVPSAPLISVLLAPALSSESIDRAVRAVLAQSYPTWELVVVDTRRDVGPPPASGDGRITIVAAPGLDRVEAQRRGLERCAGQLITFGTDIGADWLAALAWAWQASPGTSAFAGDGGPAYRAEVLHAGLASSRRSPGPGRRAERVAASLTPAADRPVVDHGPRRADVDGVRVGRPMAAAGRP